MSEGEALTPYSPLWPAVFEMEQRRLLGIFNEAVVVEHIGSTAVPGLGGKPIIDILLGTPDMALVQARIPALEAEGYRYWPELEKAVAERRFFTRLDRPPGKFHLHAVPLGGTYWNRHLAFRDALRADAQLAARYWRLKQRLAAQGAKTRATYVQLKDDFIREVVRKRG